MCRLMTVIRLIAALCASALLVIAYRYSVDGDWRATAQMEAGVILVLLGENGLLWAMQRHRLRLVLLNIDTKSDPGDPSYWTPHDEVAKRRHHETMRKLLAKSDSRA